MGGLWLQMLKNFVQATVFDCKTVLRQNVLFPNRRLLSYLSKNWPYHLLLLVLPTSLQILLVPRQSLKMAVYLSVDEN